MWRCTRPSVGPQARVVGMDLQANRECAQHAITALVDYLIGVVSLLVGKWLDRSRATARLSCRLPCTPRSWNRLGQLVRRTRGCVNRNHTGCQRTQSGRSALLLSFPPPLSLSSAVAGVATSFAHPHEAALLSCSPPLRTSRAAVAAVATCSALPHEAAQLLFFLADPTGRPQPRPPHWRDLIDLW